MPKVKAPSVTSAAYIGFQLRKTGTFSNLCCRGAFFVLTPPPLEARKKIRPEIFFWPVVCEEIFCC
jgi:hypothetical protein